MRLTDGRVLVVEDEADSMELVQGILGYYGVKSIPATTAEEALNILQDTIPSLIIIDLALPGMDGWGLLSEIRNNQGLNRVPCVAVTAYHTAEVANQAIEAGFNAYFSKPIETTSFVRELEGIVEEAL
jgi:CheY-like chemotaxis protein